MPISANGPAPEDWWGKLVVALELADLSDAMTRERLDSAAAKANNQGVHLAAAWQYARALPLLTAAIEVWARLGHVAGTVGARTVRGSVYRRIGEYAAALDDHHAALSLAEAHALIPAAARAGVGLAAALIDQEALPQAEEALQVAAAHAESAEDTAVATLVRMGQGRLAEARSAWDEARPAFAEAADRWAALVAPGQRAEALAGLARVLLAQGFIAEAYTLAGELFEHLAERGPAHLEDPLRVYWTLYRVLHVVRDEENARELLRTAHVLMLRQMEGLSPEGRARFRSEVALHRAIAEAWIAAQGEGEG